MARYRKKPVVVEAEQFWGDKPLPFQDVGSIVALDPLTGRFYVETIHNQRAFLDDGDWVIREPQGLYRAYPCKPDIFEASYDLVNE